MRHDHADKHHERHTDNYTAPAALPAQGATVTITATSAADTTVSASATITITQSVSVSVSPSTASVGVGQTQQFTATVTGTTNAAVTWSVAGGAANGTITASGLYTAPSSVPSS